MCVSFLIVKYLSGVGDFLFLDNPVGDEEILSFPDGNGDGNGEWGKKFGGGDGGSVPSH